MPARAPCTHTMHPPATSSISRRSFFPMYPNGFSMNRRKPISAAPYSEGCSATGGTNTRIFTFGYPRISERSRPSSTVASSSPEVRPQSAQQHRIDIHLIHGGSDGGKDDGIGGLIDHFGHIRIPGSPTLEEHIDGLAAGGIPILGNAGSLDQSATARKRSRHP